MKIVAYTSDGVRHEVDGVDHTDYKQEAGFCWFRALDEEGDRLIVLRMDQLSSVRFEYA